MNTPKPFDYVGANAAPPTPPTAADRLAGVYAELVALAAEAYLAERGSPMKRAEVHIRVSRRALLEALGDAGVTPPRSV